MSNNLREERLKSLEFIRQMGIDPFGGKFPGVTPIKDVLAKFPELETHDPNTGTKNHHRGPYHDPARPRQGSLFGYP